MSVFLLVRARLTDPQKFQAYTKVVPELVTKFGGRYRVMGGNAETLEGDPGEWKVVMHEWPNREAARTFWNSDEYQQAKLLREGTGEFEVQLLDALP